MRKYAGLVEYDGTEFAGWAAQPDVRTVENTLAEALGTVLRQPVKLSVAGRTDARVGHASQGSAPCRASCRALWPRSCGARSSSPWPGAPTPGCTPAGRSSPSERRRRWNRP